MGKFQTASLKEILAKLYIYLFAVARWLLCLLSDYKVLFVVRSDSFLSDSDYILLESDYILLESDYILLESDYILLESKNI